MKPFFVMGAWHSGTKLPVQILGSAMPIISMNDSEDFSPPESKKFFLKLLSRKCEFDIDDIVYFRKMLKFYRDERKITGNFVCKMPVFSFLGKFLIECYPNAPLVNIIRNGLDTSVSDLGLRIPDKKPLSYKDRGRAFAYFGKWIDRPFGISLSSIEPLQRKRPPKKHLFAAQLWKRATMSSVSNRGRPSYYEIRYEELVKKPEKISTELLKFFNLDYDEIKLQLVLDTIKPDLLNRWKKAYKKSQVVEIMQIVEKPMKILGYGDLK